MKEVILTILVIAIGGCAFTAESGRITARSGDFMEESIKGKESTWLGKMVLFGAGIQHSVGKTVETQAKNWDRK